MTERGCCVLDVLADERAQEVEDVVEREKTDRREAFLLFLEQTQLQLTVVERV